MTTNLWRFRVVTYSELSREIEQLCYQDKFRLAKLLIQLPRKEEVEQNPERRQKRGPSARLDPELVQYVADRAPEIEAVKENCALQLNRCHVSVSRRHFRMFSELQKRDPIQEISSDAVILFCPPLLILDCRQQCPPDFFTVPLKCWSLPPFMFNEESRSRAIQPGFANQHYHPPLQKHINLILRIQNTRLARTVSGKSVKWNG